MGTSLRSTLRSFPSSCFSSETPRLRLLPRLSPEVPMATLVDDQMAPIAHHLLKESPPADEASAIFPRIDGTSLVPTTVKALHLKAHAGKTLRPEFSLGNFTTKNAIMCDARLEGKLVLMVGAAGDNNGDDTVFILDSGAAVHVTGNFALFCSMAAVPPGRVVRATNRHTLPIVGSGSVVLEGFRLRDVLYVPGLTRNLVSVSKLAELEYSIQFHGAKCFVWDTRPGGALVGKGRLVAGIYHLESLEIPLDRTPAPMVQRPPAPQRG